MSALRACPAHVEGCTLTVVLVGARTKRREQQLNGKPRAAAANGDIVKNEDLAASARVANGREASLGGWRRPNLGVR
ncbi:hypothetical protein EVAR_56921_1 [Eumeta japonica]|uniref:Uncharacterized protein n=1 Tax=Eumeta variegata TaxID=151549 RepID=A0A4C1YEM3_EUMVA|nr:hypothetical protein EVAR_56921_1 [Eumeta japonica]